MKLYKPEYTQNGKKKTAKLWYLYLSKKDTQAERIRLPLYTREDVSRRAADRIKELLNPAEGTPPELLKWIGGLPPLLKERLIKAGLIDKKTSNQAVKPLTEHIDDFHKTLLARGNTELYALHTKTKINAIFDNCGFTHWKDIDRYAVETALSNLRKKGAGQRTSNYYRSAVTQFCKWMIEESRAAVNPLAGLKPIKQTEKRVQRRALTLDEQIKLLGATEAGQPHHNLTGPERALVYRLALQTGLRANEIRTLTVSAFDLKARTVTVQAANTKNKDEACLPLKRDTAEMLKQHLAGKMPGVVAFNMPANCSRMIKKDLEAAGMHYEDDSGRVADFHALRHTFGTMLAASGVHPNTAKDLMRHSTITLTMDIYTHSNREAETSAIDRLPDLTGQQRNAALV